MERTPLQRFLSSFWEVAEVILIAFISVYVIRTFIAQPFLVSGASMEPTYHDGEYLLIDELTYRFREPVRGEVVVFRYPGDDKSYFIKRIIGLPGETLAIANNKITVGTTTITEAYLPDTSRTVGEKRVTLGPDEYFVMGDNRGNSFDSRSWGPLNADHIKGLVRLRIFPFSRFQTIIAPTYAKQ